MMRSVDEAGMPRATVGMAWPSGVLKDMMFDSSDLRAVTLIQNVYETAGAPQAASQNTAVAVGGAHMSTLGASRTLQSVRSAP